MPLGFDSPDSGVRAEPRAEELVDSAESSGNIFVGMAAISRALLSEQKFSFKNDTWKGLIS